MPYAQQPPEAPQEIIQSSETKPVQSVLQARRERDGSWTVKVTTKDGVINQLTIPPAK